MSDAILEFRASHRHARIAPRKARYVMDLVRGKNVNDALRTLSFNQRRAAVLIKKVVQSALANAQDRASRDRTLDVDVDSLFLKEARVDGGPIMKRWMSRSQGRVNSIYKHSSHLHVVLAPEGADGDAQEAGGEE